MSKQAHFNHPVALALLALLIALQIAVTAGLYLTAPSPLVGYAILILLLPFEAFFDVGIVILFVALLFLTSRSNTRRVK